jgi:hypothetical protein
MIPRRTDLYLTTQKIHDRQTYMPPAEFEPAITASEWPQNDAFDRTDIGIGLQLSSL